jgi:hypothetical protein
LLIRGRVAAGLVVDATIDRTFETDLSRTPVYGDLDRIHPSKKILPNTNIAKWPRLTFGHEIIMAGYRIEKPCDTN